MAFPEEFSSFTFIVDCEDGMDIEEEVTEIKERLDGIEEKIAYLEISVGDKKIYKVFV
jgi:hypothetical protein